MMTENNSSRTPEAREPMVTKPASLKRRKERKERLDAVVANMTFKSKGTETRTRQNRTI